MTITQKEIKDFELSILDPDDLPEPTEELRYGRKYYEKVLSAAQGYDLAQFRFWKAYLRQLTISCFKWEGLPAGIPERAVEYILLTYGEGALFKDIGFLFAASASQDALNMYFEPNKIMLYTPNGSNTWFRHCMAYTEQIETPDGLEYVTRERDAVHIYDNAMRIPLNKFITLYAQRLARYDRIADLNADVQKTPWLLAYDEREKGTAKSIRRSLDANELYIPYNSAGGNLPERMIGVLNTNAPYVVDKLFHSKREIISEYLTIVGCDNSPSMKKERMIDAEATSNNEQIMLLRNSRLSMRRRFCKECKDVFGLEIACNWSVPHEFSDQGGKNDPDDMGREPSTGGGFDND